MLCCHDLPTTPRPDIGWVLVTGASGYIGGRLVQELLARGYKVRAMVRGDREGHQRRWPEAEVVAADALDRQGVSEALCGVHTAYYLIHSLLLGQGEFEAADVRAAVSFREVAAAQRVNRIIYLSGIGDRRASHSRHLRSRAKVAHELSAGAVPVTILRAATIIGAGSASYEIIRHLVDRLRVSPIPHWAQNSCQPIGVKDVIKYLVGVLETPRTTGGSYDIGGRDILTYEQMLKAVAQLLDKKIGFVRVPYSGIRFYAYLASLLTPVPAQITASLMEGLKDEVVCRNKEITRLLPFAPMSYREAIVLALTREEQDKVYTRWSDAYPPAHELALKLHELKDSPTYTASYTLDSDKSAQRLFRAVCKVGGDTGWFQNNWMWRMRGGVDRLFFGVGSARGRRRRSELRVNDVIDFWRVEEIRPPCQLLLRAEMRLPGKAWLEFDIVPGSEKTRLTVTAFFHTHSPWGRAYWYAFLPFHHFIFNGLIQQIEKRA